MILFPPTHSPAHPVLKPLVLPALETQVLLQQQPIRPGILPPALASAGCFRGKMHYKELSLAPSCRAVLWVVGVRQGRQRFLPYPCRLLACTLKQEIHLSRAHLTRRGIRTQRGVIPFTGCHCGFPRPITHCAKGQLFLFPPTPSWDPNDLRSLEGGSSF